MGRVVVEGSSEQPRYLSDPLEQDRLWEMQVPLQKEVCSSEDAEEGPRAFAEKRAPNWTGS